MASWHISAVLLALGILLLGMAEVAWAQGHGAGPAHHAAVTLPNEVFDTAYVVSAEDSCVRPVCCQAFHCAPCAVVDPTETLKERLPTEKTVIRVFGADPGRDRSIAPPTAPPRHV